MLIIFRLLFYMLYSPIFQLGAGSLYFGSKPPVTVSLEAYFMYTSCATTRSCPIVLCSLLSYLTNPKNTQQCPPLLITTVHLHVSLEASCYQNTNFTKSILTIVRVLLRGQVMPCI